MLTEDVDLEANSHAGALGTALSTCCTDVSYFPKMFSDAVQSKATIRCITTRSSLLPPASDGAVDTLGRYHS